MDYKLTSVNWVTTLSNINTYRIFYEFEVHKSDNCPYELKLFKLYIKQSKRQWNTVIQNRQRKFSIKRVSLEITERKLSLIK